MRHTDFIMKHFFFRSQNNFKILARRSAAIIRLSASTLNFLDNYVDQKATRNCKQSISFINVPFTRENLRFISHIEQTCITNTNYILFLL